MDQGFLPNSEEQNGFSAVSFDTYYNGTVHPHNKQLPAQRLAIAGLSIAYGLPNFPSKGPFPTNFEIIETDKVYVNKINILDFFGTPSNWKLHNPPC